MAGFPIEMRVDASDPLLDQGHADPGTPPLSAQLLCLSRSLGGSIVVKAETNYSLTIDLIGKVEGGLEVSRKLVSPE
jgi:hypothetical protein